MRILMIIIEAAEEFFFAFDDMITEIMTNEKFQAIVKELFIRCRKLTISLAFNTQSYFSVPKDVRSNSTLFEYGN